MPGILHCSEVVSGIMIGLCGNLDPNWSIMTFYGVSFREKKWNAAANERPLLWRQLSNLHTVIINGSITIFYNVLEFASNY